MSGFKHGRNTVVLVDQYNLSAYLNGSDLDAEVDVPPTTTYGATGVRRQIVGLKDGGLALQGLHDAVAGGSQAVLTAIFGSATASVVTRGVEGTAIGAPADLVSGREKSLKSGSPVDGVVPISAEMTADGGVDFGKFHHALGAETATGNSTSIDGLAATTNGGVGHIHATALSGTPTLDATIQDSADDSAFADIVTFTQLTAAGKQRVEITGNVRQYTRDRHVIGGGSPSITYSSAFARR